MTVNFKTTPLISDKKPYSRWVEKVKAWTELTPITLDKQDLAIALSLPEDDSISIRDKIFNELSLENLKKQDGVKTYGQSVQKYALSEAYESYTQFDKFSRTPEMTMENFITELEKYYNKTKKFDMALPEVVLAFKQLDCTGLEHKDRQLVLTGVDYKNTGNLFNQVKMSLKKFLENSPSQLVVELDELGLVSRLSQLLLLKMRKKHIMPIEVDIALIEENILVAVEMKGVVVSVMVEDVVMVEEVVIVVMTEVDMVVE